jgi:chemotaxis protein CheD
MNDFTRKGQSKITINPGEHFVSNRAVVISTLLGSCISACLYDPVNKIVGMNHFLLSNKRHPKGASLFMTEAGRYGVHAMELVINGMFKLGANRHCLRAKVFGGSSFFQSGGQADNFLRVGDENRQFIMEFLRNDNIPLAACDLGGDYGRKIFFNSDDYSVMVKKIKMPSLSRIIKAEKHLWLNAAKTYNQMEESVLWLSPDE